MKKFVLMFLCGTMILSGCGMTNNGKGAAIGAAIGTAVGGGTGAIIGKKMDQKAEELAALENAQVETVEDVNGLKAIKVTFDSGILFDFNKATLKADAKRNLDKFAAEMADLPDTDITVLGHTDNVGSAEANQKVSDNRANAVSHDQGRRERHAAVVHPIGNEIVRAKNPDFFCVQHSNRSPMYRLRAIRQAPVMPASMPSADRTMRVSWDTRWIACRFTAIRMGPRR